MAMRIVYQHLGAWPLRSGHVPLEFTGRVVHYCLPLHSITTSGA
ncbi:MAG: hypothetical protein ACJAR2_000379 [Ilumatobacter sp.]|jgi:hypothetical protein